MRGTGELSPLDWKILALLAGLLFSCQRPASVDAPELQVPPPAVSTVRGPAPTATSAPVPSAMDFSAGGDASMQWVFTHQRMDGNRWAAGRGNILEKEPLNIQLNGVPSWILGFATQRGSIWFAWLESGAVEAFEVFGDQIRPVEPSLQPLAPGQPPAGIILDGGQPALVPGYDLVSPSTHPLLDRKWEHTFVIDLQGTLLVQSPDGEIIDRHPIRALPDARLVQNSHGQIAFYAEATDRYRHGVLGDALEAGSLALIETMNGSPQYVAISFPGGLVAEGIAPLWTDLDQDGESEILVTLSDGEGGARLALFDREGVLRSESDPIGKGFRWRHQIASAPVGPGGAWEIISVLTPHIGGIVQYHRWSGDRLELVAQLSGYSSHALGSRNLDMAVVGDFDGNGTPETAVPNQPRTDLAGVQRFDNRVEEVWRFALGSVLTSNLAALTDETGQLWLAAGTASGEVWIWAP